MNEKLIIDLKYEIILNKFCLAIPNTHVTNGFTIKFIKNGNKITEIDFNGNFSRIETICSQQMNIAISSIEVISKDSQKVNEIDIITNGKLSLFSIYF